MCVYVGYAFLICSGCLYLSPHGFFHPWSSLEMHFHADPMMLDYTYVTRGCCLILKCSNCWTQQLLLIHHAFCAVI